MTATTTSTPVRAAAIFDFDGTLVPHIDHGIAPHPQIEAMKAQMQAIKDEGGVIIGNTGRPPELINNDKTGLAELPFDYICSSVGTVILQPVKGEDGKTTFQRMPEYDAYLSTPSDPNKIPYDKGTVDGFLAKQQGFSLQEPWKIGDSPRTGAYFTFKLEEGLTEEEKEKVITRKIAEVDAYMQGIIHGNAWDAKKGVSKERENPDGTVILNVDVMPYKADKIGATKWLLNHIAEQRKEAGAEPINAAIIAGDSGNDKSNMDTAYYQSIGLQPAYIVPGNGHHGLVKHVQAEQQNGAIISIGMPIPAELSKTSQEYFNHDNYGLGGVLQGLQMVRDQLREKLNMPETPTKIASHPQIQSTVKERQAGLELPF
jgi:hydroxymethylpyrimidine pyrophosphatase-like HAD family hydrolase